LASVGLGGAGFFLACRLSVAPPYIGPPRRDVGRCSAQLRRGSGVWDAGSPAPPTRPPSAADRLLYKMREVIGDGCVVGLRRLLQPGAQPGIDAEYQPRRGAAGAVGIALGRASCS
jgi:hypothetical protein